MILTVEQAKGLINGLDSWTDERIRMKLEAVEQTIRSYTNNSFQNRSVRGYCPIGINTSYGFAFGYIPGLSAGDTIQVTESAYNNGLYVVSSVTSEGIVLDKAMKPEDCVLITKIEYPADVIDCAVNLMDWEANQRSKVGIKQESLSRHSVTYYDQDSNNTVMGYPVSLLGGLKPYRKARF